MPDEKNAFKALTDEQLNMVADGDDYLEDEVIGEPMACTARGPLSQFVVVVATAQAYRFRRISCNRDKRARTRDGKRQTEYTSEDGIKWVQGRTEYFG